MPISSDAFRDALRHFPIGVTVVTIRSGDETHGLTVSSFASVSLDPPLITIMVDHRHFAHELLERPGSIFAVNILAEEHRELSEWFAHAQEGERFAAGRWTVAKGGAPVLEDALVWLECSVFSRHTAGTHTLYVGLVEASFVPRPGGRPLVYWNRGYRRLELGAENG